MSEANEPDARSITAPFTPEQVAHLNAWQSAGYVHPFTCGAPHDGGAVTLVATEAGWVCPSAVCDYTQGWAHVFMADGSLPENPMISLTGLL